MRALQSFIANRTLSGVAVFSVFFPFAVPVGGCASNPSSAASDASADAIVTNRCAAAGGQCVALTPSVQCPAGFAPADYSEYPCADESMAGASCCLPLDGGASDAGKLCTKDGSFSAPAGTCNGKTCPAGCACVIEASGASACLCTGAAPPDGGDECIEPTCGSIFCDSRCTCTSTGTCTCGDGGI